MTTTATRTAKPRFSTTIRSASRSGAAVVVGKLWVEREGQTAMSWLRARLLERIGALGSISQAAREIGISYTKAWRMVKELNALFGRALVERQAGGRGGGGARFTPPGRPSSTATGACSRASRAG